MSDLENAAKIALENGYLPGNGWETMLDLHMAAHLPKLTAELGDDYSNWLIVQTNDVLTEMQRMILEDGVAPDLARMLARRDLLPMGEDDAREMLEEMQLESRAAAESLAT